MQTKRRPEALIHYVISFVGGYFGIYAIMARSGIFASAQTNNMICLVHDLLDCSMADFFARLGALFLYFLAIALTVWIPEHFPRSLKLLSVAIDSAACLLLGFLPGDLNPVIGLYPIFFAMAFQWCSFRGAEGFVGSTTFSTNNLRQFTTGIVHLLMRKEEENPRGRIRFYGLTLLGFHLGVTAGFLLWQVFPLRSIWFCLLPLGFAAACLLPQRAKAGIRSLLLPAQQL